MFDLSPVAHAIGLVAQGKRRDGRWVHKAVAEATEKIRNDFGFSSRYLEQAGAILDFDAAKGTDYAGDILDIEGFRVASTHPSLSDMCPLSRVPRVRYYRNR